MSIGGVNYKESLSSATLCHEVFGVGRDKKNQSHFPLTTPLELDKRRK